VVSQVIGQIVNVLMTSSIYIMVALGFALVFSVMRIMNFAHGAIYMIGGFVCYYFSVSMDLGPWVALPLTTCVMALFGVFIEKFCFRPFRRDFEKATVMAIALVTILKTGADLTVGPLAKGMPPLVAGSINIGPIAFGADRLVVLFIVCLLLTALIILVRRTQIGQAMLAIAHDPEAASLMGININRVSSLVCAMGCGLAGLAGGLVGSVLVLHVSVADSILVRTIGVIILSGIGSIGGIWAGGLAMGALDTLGPYFLPFVMSDPFEFALVVLILIIKPQGFFGHEL